MKKTGDPVVALFLDDMAMFYNTGKRHKDAGRAMYDRLEFINCYPDINKFDVIFSSKAVSEHLVYTLYAAYCNGYNGEEL